VTQAVLLGQADLAADYKKHPRMSPRKENRVGRRDQTTEE